MITKTIGSFFDLIKEFFLSYRKDIQVQYPYKIVAIKKNSKEEHLLKIKIANKSVIFDLKAIDIVNDDVILKSFSPYDIRTICYYAFTDQNSPQFKIVSQLFSSDSNGMLIIKKRGEKKVMKKHISKFIHNEEIIESLPAKDALRLGYIKAITEKIEDEIEKSKLKLLVPKI